MNKRWISTLTMISALSLLAACGGGSDSGTPTTNSTPAAQSTPADSAQSSAKPAATDASKAAAPATNASKSDAQTITAFSNEWSALNKKHEKAINSYDGMPIIEIVAPGLAFVTGVQYDLLNSGNQDGRFEGKLVLAGFDGFIEKKGTGMTFGYDHVLDKDGFGPTQKTGDRTVENGSFDAKEGYFKTERFTERGGQKIRSDYTEIKRLKDGSMLCLDLSGHTLNAKGDQKPGNTFTFMHVRNDGLDFVVASAAKGTDFAAISFADQGEMTKAAAIELFTKVGYKIEKTGAVKDNMFVVD